LSAEDNQTNAEAPGFDDETASSRMCRSRMGVDPH
jgi:hypothetical protein